MGYRYYNFNKRDPIVGKVLGLIERSGYTFSYVAEESGVTVQTLYNWNNGDVISPRFVTLAAVVKALGADLDIVNHRRR